MYIFGSLSFEPLFTTERERIPFFFAGRRRGILSLPLRPCPEKRGQTSPKPVGEGGFGNNEAPPLLLLASKTGDGVQGTKAKTQV